MTDHFGIDLTNARHVVALTDTVTIDYVDDVDQMYARGLYSFSRKDKAEKFTTLCNNTTEGYGEIAFLFSKGN